MDFSLIAIDYRDSLWLSIAFIAGFALYRVGLPPLVGFLVAGFALNFLGAESTHFLTELADFGVTLLLFSIGLKLKVSSLFKPEIWGVATMHMLVTTCTIAAITLGIGATGIALFSELDLTTALLVGFALSFSSTVFAVKTLESIGQMGSRYGRIAIGILIMQDIVAVAFLAASSGMLPSPWAFALLALIPMRKPILMLLNKTGHGELMILFGFVLALGGAQLFEMFNLKGDLGALFIGALLAGNVRSAELAKSLFGFKELFLVAFFLSIGLSGIPTLEIFIAACILLLLIPLKTLLFYLLLTRFRVTAVQSNRTSMVLANYSEFGLIVEAIAVSNGWISNDWILVIAVALSLSFALSAALNTQPSFLFERYFSWLRRFEKPERLPEDEPIDLGNASILVFGMGRVGTGVYDAMEERLPGQVIGVDYDEAKIPEHRKLGRNVVSGNASTPDFWDRVRVENNIEYVMLAIPEHKAQLDAIALINKHGFKGKIAAHARYPDELEKLKEIGVDAAFNIYAEAGSGFANHAAEAFQLDKATAGSSN